MAVRSGWMGPIFDLAHLAALSDDPVNTLVVSDRTLYCLQNLAAVIEDKDAWFLVEQFANGRYRSVESWDPEYSLFQSVVEGIELEVLTVPEIVDLLQSIDARLAAFGQPYGQFASIYTSASVTSPGSIATLTASFPTDPERGEVQAIYVWNSNRAISSVRLYVDNGIGIWTLVDEAIPVAGSTDYAWSGRVSVGQSAVVVGQIFGAQAGDTCNMRVIGVELN